MKRQILMATLLLSAIAVFSSMSFAHNTTGGCSSRTDFSITSNQNWATMCSKTLTLTDATHKCVVTAGAEVANPGTGIDNWYRFTVDTVSNPVTNSHQERTIELNQNTGVSDPNMEVVSTVREFELSPGTYTFYWLARKFNASTAAGTVSDYSMGVVCTDDN
jgi:hypothetical protein